MLFTRSTILVSLLLPVAAGAQLSGTASVPGTYSTVGEALTDLNTSGIAASFTLNIAAGHTETAVAGGYTLSATGTASEVIIIRKNGSGPNPVIYAQAGTKTPGAATQDGILRIVGGDYITIEGIDFVDWNVSAPATMEFGIGLFKTDSTNGCQHNVIRNCHISLNRSNNSGGTGPASDGSRGIEIVSALSNAHTTWLGGLGALSANSFNIIENNLVENCNVAIALTGLVSSGWSPGVDTANKITGNRLLNFGGGGATSAAAGIRCRSQYGALIAGNYIVSNDGRGSPHVATLRGIHLLDGQGASSVVEQNTVSVHGGGTGSQLAAIVNEAGSGNSGFVVIRHNVIGGCSYKTAVNGSFYGIWNNAAVPSLSIAGNRFLHNSTGASGGSNYLIYNNGNVTSLSITQNTLSCKFNGTQSYSGTAYGIYNSSASGGGSVTITGNVLRDFFYVHQAGTGNLYLINNAASCNLLQVDSNFIHDLALNHNNPVYVIYNSSATNSLLSVRHNTIMNIHRSGTAGHLYGYYGASTAAGTARHFIHGNLLSGITATNAGSGNFYGIYNAEGNNSPFPQKSVTSNTIENVHMNGTGIFYGIYATDLGDAGDSAGSTIADNIIRGCTFTDNVYGLYCAGPVSPSFAAQVQRNLVYNISSVDGSAYGTYLSSNNAGVNFMANRISGISATGSTSSAYGLYGAGTTTSNIVNNIIGHIGSVNAGGANRSNGIYISSGQIVNLVYNTVYIQVSGTGANAGSNALYASSTASVTLNNNILVNKSPVSGSGIASAYRRSTATMGSYNTTSDNNLFYTNAPVSGTPVFYSGSAISSFTAFQSYASPRESNSVYFDPVFISMVAASPNYLHLKAFPYSPAESGAAVHPVSGHDVDNDPRYGHSAYSGNGTAPDIGADEFVQQLQPCNSVSAPVVVQQSVSVCAGDSICLLALAQGAGADVVYTWEIASSPAGTFSAAGGNGLEYQTGSLNAGTWYYRLQNTCTNTAQSAASPVVTVVVTVPPQPAVMPAAITLCEGDSVVLSVSGSTGQIYHWLGPDGFSSWDQQVSIAQVTASHSGQYSVTVTKNGCAGTSPSATINISQVTASLTAGKVLLCAGDTTVLKVSGNVVTYTWSNGAQTPATIVQPTLSTVYSCTAVNTDGCFSEDSIAVAVLSPTISAISATVCGTAPFATVSVQTFSNATVQWYAATGSTAVLGTGNTFTLPGSASATVFAQASGACVSPVIPVQLEVTPVPAISAVISPTAVCPGKQAMITLSGAGSYTWTGMSGGASVVVTPVSTANYTVKGSSVPGCTGSLVIQVPVFPVPAVSIAPAAYSVCPSAKLTMTADGAISYTWNTGTTAQVATVAPAGSTTYTVYGNSSDGCVSSQTIAIHTRSVPVISVIQSADTVCPGEPVLLTASGAVSYTWVPGSVTGRSITVHPVVPAVFNVIGITVNSCTNIGFAYVDVALCTGIQHVASQGIRCFPNPSTGIFNLEFSSPPNAPVKIFDCYGRYIHAVDPDRQIIKIDLRTYPAGIYFVECAGLRGTTRIKLIRH